jgi:hypothetical protein
VAGTTTSAITKLVIEVTQSNALGPAGPNYLSDVFSDKSKFMYSMIKLQDQGHRDAIALFNRYGCDGAVAHTVVENINIYFDPNRRTPQPAEGNALPAPNRDLKPRGDCVITFSQWRKRAVARAAFAITQGRGGCGWSQRQADMETAVRKAVQACGAYGSGCTVIDEK